MPKGNECQNMKRILIASYGNVLVPELIKILDSKEYCLFVLFNDTTGIGFIQKALGKKRLIPIFSGNSDKVKSQSYEISDELIKALPEMDVVINFDNSTTISKFYDKRKRFKTSEMKFHKVTAPELKNFIVSSTEKCLLNLLPESTIGLKHMFDVEGLDVPIRTHISTSFQNSFRKLFRKKSEGSKPDNSVTTVSLTPTAGRSTPTHNESPTEEGAATQNSEHKTKTSKKIHRLSFMRDRTKEPLVATRSEPNLVASTSNSTPTDHFQNELRHKENASYKKSLNKLHSKNLRRQTKEMKKLEARKLKKQNTAEKVIEEEMRIEKGRLDSKCNDLNSETLARSTALTPDTANKIIASREARVNKEVFRNANRKKVTEFEKIEESHQEKVIQLKRKQVEELIKLQLETIEHLRKKHDERLIKKSVHRSETVS